MTSTKNYALFFRFDRGNTENIHRTRHDIYVEWLRYLRLCIVVTHNRDVRFIAFARIH